jgi:hypothetical protein
MVSTFTAGNIYTYYWYYATPIYYNYDLSLKVVSLNEQTVIATISDYINPGYDINLPFLFGYYGYITAMMPLNVPSGQYKLKLTLNTDYPVILVETFTFIGATFTILSYPSLMYRNEVYTVTWSSSNSEDINNGKVRADLLLYPENTVVITLGTANGNTYSLQFRIPYDIEYGNYTIRLVSLANTNFTATSNTIKLTGQECIDPVFIPPDIDAIPPPGLGINPIPDNNPYNTYESGGYTVVADDKYTSTDQNGDLVISDRPDSTTPLQVQSRSLCVLPFPRSGKKPVEIFNPRVRFSFGTKTGNRPENFIVNNCCQLQTYNPN